MTPLKNVPGYSSCSPHSLSLCNEFESATSILKTIPTQIQEWCEVQNVKPLFVLQFGSSVQEIPKLVSDIDCLFVFNQLPKERSKMWELTDSLEITLEKSFTVLRNLGFHYSFSPVFRSSESLNRFSYFYLDLPEHSRLIFEKEPLCQNFLSRIENFRNVYKAEKTERGGQLVWNLSQTLSASEAFEPRF
jgi:predicted nucleotidyltransferase